MVSRTPPAQSVWLSLGEASRMLGITPATLRRWADRGQVTTFVTPGGHRRFPRASIERLLPRDRGRRPALGRLGASARRVRAAYGRAMPADRRAPTTWLADLSEADRVELRERGNRLLEILLQHLEEEGRSQPGSKLADASAMAAEYGRRAAILGASVTDAVESFIRFRRAFTGELAGVARRRGLDTREATALLVGTDAAMDRLLVALVYGHGGQG